MLLGDRRAEPPMIQKSQQTKPKNKKNLVKNKILYFYGLHGLWQDKKNCIFSDCTDYGKKKIKFYPKYFFSMKKFRF